MLTNNYPIETVINNAITLLTKEKEYSKRTSKAVICTWMQFREFCINNEYNSYSTEAKNEFIHNIQNNKPTYKNGTIVSKIKNMQILDLIANHKNWSKGKLYPKPELSEEFSAFIEKQETFLKSRNYSVFSLETIQKQMKSMFYFFQNKGITDFKHIEKEHINMYIMSLKGHARSTLRGELSRVRQVFRNAYLLKFTTHDMSCYVPTFNLGHSQSKIKIWNSYEIHKLLNSIDKANPKGLRDTAIIVIASELGMRHRDIINLKLSDIDWEMCSITFIQSKTGKVNTLPVNEKIGNAIIDYLHIRPETDHDYLFVNFNPPYDKMKTFSSSFNEYVKRAGITVPTEAHHNMHSQRATVATRLLEAGVSPDDIFSFLGHSDRESLHNYIRMDIEHLRECALSFEDGEFV